MFAGIIAAIKEFILVRKLVQSGKSAMSSVKSFITMLKSFKK